MRLAISHDGRVLASSSADGVIRTWSLPDLRALAEYPDQPDLVVALSFSADGEELIAGRMDGTLESYVVDTVVHETAEHSGGGVTPVRVAGEMTNVEEAETGRDLAGEMPVKFPARITGNISQPGDTDFFRFAAKAGEEWVVEVDAARSESLLDSKIAVLDANREPVERVRLQAVRESWLTFRGKDSTTSGDFRVHNWRLMELNELLYVNGEVVKLWLYPRGPDSGFIVYPGSGSRRTYFDTTAVAHPLGQPCYTVEPLPPGASPVQNGLPVFPNRTGDGVMTRN